MLFKDERGTESEAQITAFEDTWHWNRTAESTYSKLVTQAPDWVSKMIAALREFVGTNHRIAYLVLINRLKQYRRIAIRYEKRAENYRALLTIAAILLWL